jgi:hypothetical protein
MTHTELKIVEVVGRGDEEKLVSAVNHTNYIFSYA